MTKRILILGSGMVAGPIIKYLIEKQYTITIATPLVERAQQLAGNRDNCHIVDWTIDNKIMLSDLVAGHDLIISLIPYIYHVEVARQCIQHKKNMLTTSYVSEEMRKLDEDAVNAGIIILNECGLDPGIDHMSAMRIIDQVHEKKGIVDVFYSFCGALPAPESADNPFRYKFSWSPHGVLLAGNNSAQYVKNGILVNVPARDLFKDVRTINFPNFGQMEVYPNRDSLSYIDLYGIHEVCSLMRGTIRYPGWCEIMDAFKKLDLFSQEIKKTASLSYRQFISMQAQIMDDEHFENSLCQFLGIKTTDLPFRALEWVGFLSDKIIGDQDKSPFEITSELMIPKMLLSENENDMVQMLHLIEVTYPDGNKQTIHSSMLVYGEPGGETAVARTVALPAAIAAELILNGEISLKGVRIPIYPQIYQPVLSRLESLGISLREEFGVIPDISDNLKS